MPTPLPLHYLTLTSGGKDSHLSSHLLSLPPYSHVCVGYVHVAPVLRGDPEGGGGGGEENSFMFQSACSDVVVGCLGEVTGLPVYVLRVGGGGVVEKEEEEDDATNGGGAQGFSKRLHYVPSSPSDEIELLYRFLLHLRSHVLPSSGLPQPTALCSGATMSTYQRTRVESVCGRMGWRSMAPLWRMGEGRILGLCKGMDVRVVKVRERGGVVGGV